MTVTGVAFFLAAYGAVSRGQLGMSAYAVAAACIAPTTGRPPCAALLTFFVLLVWTLLGTLSQSADEPLRTVLRQLAFSTHMEGFTAGVLELDALIFFVSAIVFALLLTHLTVEAQRWA